MVRTIFDQPDAAEVRAQFGRVVDTIAAKYPDAATHLDEARDDLLAFTAFPHERDPAKASDSPGQYPDRDPQQAEQDCREPALGQDGDADQYSAATPRILVRSTGDRSLGV